MKKSFNKGIKIVEKKNCDYATNDDAFKNFRFAQQVGVSPCRAVLVRIADKLARISNLLDKEAKVEDETVSDTLLDCINYLAILKCMLESGEK